MDHRSPRRLDTIISDITYFRGSYSSIPNIESNRGPRYVSQIATTHDHSFWSGARNPRDSDVDRGCALGAATLRDLYPPSNESSKTHPYRYNSHDSGLTSRRAQLSSPRTYRSESPEVVAIRLYSNGGRRWAFVGKTSGQVNMARTSYSFARGKSEIIGYVRTT